MRQYVLYHEVWVAVYRPVERRAAFSVLQCYVHFFNWREVVNRDRFVALGGEMKHILVREIAGSYVSAKNIDQVLDHLYIAMEWSKMERTIAFIGLFVDPG